MIILITGASHTGKTALAQKLLEKYQYPYLSIDHLKMGLIRSGNTKLTPMSNDKELTAYLWPIVCEMIKTAIENKQNLVVEGCYVPFDWAKDFEKEKTFVSFDKNNVIIDALKKSQSEDGYILRLYESKKQRGSITARLGFNISKIVECKSLCSLSIIWRVH